MDVQDPLLPELLALSTLTLATRGPDGSPFAAPVYFAASPQLQLYFFSSPHSQHGRNLADDGRAAVAFYPESAGWESIRGAQMRGRAAALPAGEGWDRAWQAFQHKFAFVEDMRAEIARNRLYAFTPHWVRLVDNRRGFGFKREWGRP